MKKLTPQAINEVLDVAFEKLPFHVYMVMCDVGEVALRVERSKKEAKNKHLVSKASKRRRK
jgi:hypothetical protein